MSLDDKRTLAYYNAQYLAYLNQRAGGSDQRCFAWVDERWPSCAAMHPDAPHLEAPVDPPVAAVVERLRSKNPGVLDFVWVRYLARISYCAAICLHPDEAVDAVLHAEVGDVEGPLADAIRGHLERAVNVLASEGMMNPELSLRLVSQ